MDGYDRWRNDWKRTGLNRTKYLSSPSRDGAFRLYVLGPPSTGMSIGVGVIATEVGEYS